MISSAAPLIIAADRLKDGLVIEFDDGRCAFYSGALLHSKLAECEELNEASVEW